MLILLVSPPSHPASFISKLRCPAQTKLCGTVDSKQLVLPQKTRETFMFFFQGQWRNTWQNSKTNPKYNYFMLHLDQHLLLRGSLQRTILDPVEASELQEASRSANYTEVYGDELSVGELYIVPSLPVIPPEVWCFRYVFGVRSYLQPRLVLGSLGV